jgi:cellulose synthase/poly-beta-1,6-N-acetylglucosamine synthase-like glycosyltransferase
MEKLMMMKELGYLLFGTYVLLTLWLLANAIVQLHLWRLSKKKTLPDHRANNGPLPFVSVQVPVYNEKYVVEGLLDCLANFDYPKQLYEVLVLDDSTDETVHLVDQKVASLKEKGLAIQVYRRTVRHGYKAGALQESLPFCKGSLVAIFDADFRPHSDYLNRLVPYLNDQEVGLVQARWTHVNKDQNALTRIQSYLLDTYFSVELAGRFKAGYFTNFCGTAGIWKKACIEDAGGWDSHILSEDLDISFRAQLRNWKIVYAEDTTVPAELPSEIEAFKIQQARWTKGIMQVLRKSGKAVLHSSLPATKKFHALFQLSGSFVFVCLFINSFLSLPLLLLRHSYAEFITYTNFAAIGGFNLLFLTLVFYHGARAYNNEEQFARYYPQFLVIYMGLSVQNTLAVLQGLAGHRSPFVRTPKYATNKAKNTSYFPRKNPGTHYYELAMFLYFLSGIALSFYLQDYFFLLLFVMMSCGLGFIVYHSFGWRIARWSFSWPKFSWR